MAGPGGPAQPKGKWGYPTARPRGRGQTGSRRLEACDRPLRAGSGGETRGCRGRPCVAATRPWRTARPRWGDHLSIGVKDQPGQQMLRGCMTRLLGRAQWKARKTQGIALEGSGAIQLGQRM
nr:uncharacterized protein LOC104651983 [Saimiri boliviensis boliviensis]